MPNLRSLKEKRIKKIQNTRIIEDCNDIKDRSFEKRLSNVHSKSKIETKKEYNKRKKERKTDRKIERKKRQRASNYLTNKSYFENKFFASFIRKL